MEDKFVLKNLVMVMLKQLIMKSEYILWTLDPFRNHSLYDMDVNKNLCKLQRTISQQ